MLRLESRWIFHPHQLPPCRRAVQRKQQPTCKLHLFFLVSFVFSIPSPFCYYCTPFLLHLPCCCHYFFRNSSSGQGHQLKKVWLAGTQPRQKCQAKPNKLATKNWKEAKKKKKWENMLVNVVSWKNLVGLAVFEKDVLECGAPWEHHHFSSLRFNWTLKEQNTLNKKNTKRTGSVQKEGEKMDDPKKFCTGAKLLPNWVVEARSLSSHPIRTKRGTRQSPALLSGDAIVPYTKYVHNNFNMLSRFIRSCRSIQIVVRKKNFRIINCIRLPSPLFSSAWLAPTFFCTWSLSCWDDSCSKILLSLFFYSFSFFSEIGFSLAFPVE